MTPIEQKKLCTTCKIAKPFADFNKRKGMASGCQSSCRACGKAKYVANRAVWLAQRRNYRIANRAAESAYQRDYKAKYPERTAAWKAAQRANPLPPTSCQMCHTTERTLERHHPDYQQPTRIEWLCKPCHYIADQQRQFLLYTTNMTLTLTHVPSSRPASAVAERLSLCGGVLDNTYQHPESLRGSTIT